MMLLNRGIPASYIFNKVKKDLVYVLVVSLLVLIITESFRSLLPELPLTIPAFIGTALSVLLSFKLNQSYDRWWEARKIWGAIVNDSRSLILQLQSFVSDGNEESVKRIAMRQIAWCYALGQALRGLDPIEHIKNCVSEDDLRQIHQHNNKPLALLQLHAQDIRALRNEEQLDAYSHVQLDSTLVRLCDAQGKAERIKSTVFPVTYRVFLHAFIYLFVVTLSVALKDIGIVFEISLLVLISTAFFLLEKSATHMQDPFENKPTDTAMTSISRNIEINIKQLLNIKDVPDPLPSNTFYIT